MFHHESRRGPRVTSNDTRREMCWMRGRLWEGGFAASTPREVFRHARADTTLDGGLQGVEVHGLRHVFAAARSEGVLAHILRGVGGEGYDGHVAQAEQTAYAV